ncbi:MBG domain-containing protein, partial [Azoarcus indigens]
ANSGTVQARTLAEKEGRILLLADMSHGEVKHSGLLDASAPQSGDGGFIETSAATVTLESGRKVTTLAANGQTGSWLIDPNDYTIAANGGNLTGAELSADLASTSVTISTATQGTAGGNGDIFVNDAVSWNAATTLTLNAQRNIEINAPITVANAGGGLALNYGGSDYSLGAPVSFTAGSGGSFSVNGQAYTLIHSMAELAAIESTGPRNGDGWIIGNYALATNLDAAGQTYGRALIGHFGTFFNGTFTGLGHIIRNLTVDGGTNSVGGSSSYYVGLFGYTMRNSLIRDLGLVDASMHGYQAVGGLAGVNYGTLKGVFATGEVWAEDGGVGGLVGWNVGRIENAYAGAEIAGNYDVGGVVGWNGDDSFSGQQGYILNVYSMSVARGQSGSFGGLVGSNWLVAAASVVNSYYYGSAGSYGGTGGSAVSADQLKNLSTFGNWDIDNVGGSGSTWRIYEGYSTPLLRAFLTPVKVSVGVMGDKTYDGFYASGSSDLHQVPGNVTLQQGQGPLYYTTTGADAGSYSTAAGNLRITGNALYSTQTGYDILYEGALNIDKATLTVTANDAAKTYDGQAWSGGNGVSYSGFVNGEDESVLSGTLSYGGSGQGAVNAGSYAISASGLGSGNYSLSYVDGTLTVDKAALTVRSHGDGKTYDGLAYAGGGVVSYDGFVNGEDASVLSGSLAYGGDAQGAINAGNYTISLSGLSSNNYAIGYVDGTLAVHKAALTVTANDAAKTYDGQAWSGGNGVSYSGFVNGEDASVLSGTLSYGGSGQGAVNAGGYAISASGLASGNYFISYVDGVLTVNKAALTVTANDASKTYDGRAWSGGNGVSYSGLAGGDTAAVLDGAPSYGGASQGAMAAGSYAISVAGLSSDNYDIRFVDGLLTIGRPLQSGDAARLGERARQSEGAQPPQLRLAAAGLGQPAPLSLAQGFIALPTTAE